MLIGLEPNTNYIGISSIDVKNPLKRIPFLLSVFEKIKNLNSNYEILVLNNISHSKMPVFINSCSLIILASTYEGWPNIIKESCACGVPFVSTDVSDLRERFKKLENYCQVSSYDVQEFYLKTQKILDNFSHTYEERLVLRNSIKDFNLINISKKLTDLYKSIDK